MDAGGILLLALLGLLLLSLAAAIDRRTEELNDIMASWLGASEQELYLQWGPPNEVHSDGAGGKIVVYRYTRSYTTPGTATTTYNYYTGRAETTYMPPTTTTVESYRMFWINARGVIYHWEWKGL